MPNINITRCETSACPYILNLQDDPSESAELIIGDSDTPEYVTRTRAEVRLWLASLVDPEIDQLVSPPLKGHEGEGFKLEGGTLYIPMESYAAFVGQLIAGEQFQEYLPPELELGGAFEGTELASVGTRL